MHYGPGPSHWTYISHLALLPSGERGGVVSSRHRKRDRGGGDESDFSMKNVCGKNRRKLGRIEETENPTGAYRYPTGKITEGAERKKNRRMKLSGTETQRIFSRISFLAEGGGG